MTTFNKSTFNVSSSKCSGFKSCSGECIRVRHLRVLNHGQVLVASNTITARPPHWHFVIHPRHTTSALSRRAAVPCLLVLLVSSRAERWAASRACLTWSHKLFTAAVGFNAITRLDFMAFTHAHSCCSCLSVKNVMFYWWCCPFQAANS